MGSVSHGGIGGDYLQRLSTIFSFPYFRQLTSSISWLLYSLPYLRQSLLLRKDFIGNFYFNDEYETRYAIIMEHLLFISLSDYGKN